jgi:hypoxanthine phosphoribosyltransferase
MPEFEPVLSKEDIDRAVAEIARRISADYKTQGVVLIGVLKGAFIFLADLVRKLTIPVKVDFVRLASYGCGTCTSGTIRLTKDLEIDIRDKDVVIVEDIIDTGLSLQFLIDHLRSFNPKSLRLCALIDKRERRETQIQAEYVGYLVEKGFLVGYGLDYAEDYRNLPAIFDLKNS